MDFLKAVNIIGRDLDEAMALLEQLNGISGPELAEIELARSRVRSASDLLKLLPGLTGNRGVAAAPGVAVHTPAEEPKTETKPHEEMVTELITVPQPEPVSETKDVSVPEPVIEPQAVYQPEPVAETVLQSEHAPPPAAESSHSDKPAPSAEPVKQPVATQKNHEALKSILADRFSQTGTLGDKISPVRQDEAISTAMHSKPIADIGAAIGINDRFYFIRELFSGDAIAYSDTIRRLNNSASLGEAMRILDESTVMGSDPAAQSSFVDVVRRKFSLNV